MWKKFVIDSKSILTEVYNIAVNNGWEFNKQFWKVFEYLPGY